MPAHLVCLPQASRGAPGSIPPSIPPTTRPTRAEIDLDAVCGNLRVLAARVAPSRVLAVVKADAYGHGLIEVGRALEHAGVDGLCVALAEEGLALREAGVQSPILVLNGAYGAAHAQVLAQKLTPVVYSRAQIEAFARAADKHPVDVHLKLDTGMARLGVPLSELSGILDALAAAPNVRIEGVLTHLSSADSDAQATEAQLDRFEAALGSIRARGHRPSYLHAANSAAALACPRARYDLVRPGIALYGVAPDGCEQLAAELTPAMRVVTELIALRELPAGSPVGYDQTFRTLRTTRIGTVPMGYGDGLLRAASNRGHMLVRGQRVPIVGRVSMDLTTLDVTDVPECAVGDSVTLIGEQQGSCLTARDLAEASSTIAYEVLTNLSPRVPRLYWRRAQ